MNPLITTAIRRAQQISARLVLKWRAVAALMCLSLAQTARSDPSATFRTARTSPGATYIHFDLDIYVHSAAAGALGTYSATIDAHDYINSNASYVDCAGINHTTAKTTQPGYVTMQSSFASVYNDDYPVANGTLWETFIAWQAVPHLASCEPPVFGRFQRTFSPQSDGRHTYNQQEHIV